MNFIKAASAIGIYIVLLLLTYYCYISLLEVDVVFYSSIYSAIFALVIFFPVLLAPMFKSLSRLEIVQTLVICGLLGYIFAISVPTVIDRSLSFYILEKLQQRGGAIRLSKFEYIFTNEYMREHRLVDVRLTEQAASGTIVVEGDCVFLTPRGEKLANFSRFFRGHFLPKRRLLAGEYTDILTDPFARSDDAPDYLCR